MSFLLKILATFLFFFTARQRISSQKSYELHLFKRHFEHCIIYHFFRQFQLGFSHCGQSIKNYSVTSLYQIDLAIQKSTARIKDNNIC